MSRMKKSDKKNQQKQVRKKNITQYCKESLGKRNTKNKNTIINGYNRTGTCPNTDDHPRAEYLKYL